MAAAQTLSGRHQGEFGKAQVHSGLAVLLGLLTKSRRHVFRHTCAEALSECTGLFNFMRRGGPT